MERTDMDRIIEEVRADVLPFESWERLTGETAAAFAAFCAFRDFGAERSVPKAVKECYGKKDGGEPADPAFLLKKCRMWRNWAAQYKWRERAEAYDQYIDRLKQAEKRKAIEAQGEVHRLITGKMLQVVNKKLDLMEPGELSQGNITEWVETAIKTEREIAGLEVGGKEKPADGWKQGEIKFTPEFEGL
ncbi:hypothetical protein FACS189447_09680 [Spirochaetia bacterium]|nr:hypothetical protein FACS189447_09680 [Spirochaetia bacterium]